MDTIFGEMKYSEYQFSHDVFFIVVSQRWLLVTIIGKDATLSAENGLILVPYTIHYPEQNRTDGFLSIFRVVASLHSVLEGANAGDW